MFASFDAFLDGPVDVEEYYNLKPSLIASPDEYLGTNLVSTLSG